MDECNRCADIEVEVWEEYDKLLLQLEDGAKIDPWPRDRVGVIPQLWEGMTGVVADGRENGGGTELGKISTRFVDGEGWVETWVIHDPDTTLRQPARLPWLKAGRLGDILSEVAAEPDADEYGVLAFAFQYLCPPSTSAIDHLPTVVPPFVTDVFLFSVYFTEAGVEHEAGALYRERIDVPTGSSVPPGIRWQDTWVLWDNFDVPSPDPVLAAGREVRLEATSWGGETVRTFLDDQLFTQPGKCVVRTHSDITPVP